MTTTANTTAPQCQIGQCSRDATRRVEIRRDSAEEHPAEVRHLCASRLCLRLAFLSGQGFHLTVRKGS